MKAPGKNFTIIRTYTYVRTDITKLTGAFHGCRKANKAKDGTDVNRNKFAKQIPVYTCNIEPGQSPILSVLHYTCERTVAQPFRWTHMTYFDLSFTRFLHVVCSKGKQKSESEIQAKGLTLSDESEINRKCGPES
jgi:hypothetical protein